MDNEESNRWIAAMAILLLSVIMAKVIEIATILQHLDFVIRH